MLRARTLAQVHVLAFLETPLALFGFALLISGFGLIGIVVGGGIATVLLLVLAGTGALHNSQTAAWLSVLAGVAVIAAIAGTIISGQLCSPGDPDGCGSIPPEVDYT